MGQRKPPPVFVFILPAILISAMGLGGLYWVIRYTLPTVGFRWLFFFLLPMAISGPLMPVIAFLHQRFPSDPPAKVTTVIRESILGGLFISILAWLQLGRVLSEFLGVGILVIIVVIGIVMRAWEKSRWEPEPDSDADMGSTKKATQNS
jgi:hypothetical protein